MVRSASKRFGLRRRLGILWLLTRNNWQQETAYFTSRVLGIITPLMYVLSFIFFTVTLYRNISSVAGYSRDEMLFLIFLGQVSFYLYGFWGQSSEYLESYVNKGEFDYFLVRPMPSLFYATFHRILPLQGVVNLLGPLTPIWMIIRWPQLDIVQENVPYGVIILLAGIILYHQFQFIISLVCFWTGRGRQAQLLVYAVSSQTIPLEGFTTGLRWIFLGIMPVFVSSVAASVFLGKADPLFWCPLILSVLTVFSIVKRIAWSRALRQYGSASS